MWVWTQEEPKRLGPRTKRLLLGAEHENGISPVSTLEIVRLVAAGGSELSVALSEWVARFLADLAAYTLAVTMRWQWGPMRCLGTFHWDPTDRGLVATAA